MPQVFQVRFKVLVLTSKTLNGLGSMYLRNYLLPYAPFMIPKVSQGQPPASTINVPSCSISFETLFCFSCLLVLQVALLVFKPPEPFWKGGTYI